MKLFIIYRQIRTGWPLITLPQAWILATSIVALGGEPLSD